MLQPLHVRWSEHAGGARCARPFHRVPIPEGRSRWRRRQSDTRSSQNKFGSGRFQKRVRRTSSEKQQYVQTEANQSQSFLIAANLGRYSVSSVSSAFFL